MTAAAASQGDADVARVAALLGDPSRARMLIALADGRALPASVLAAEAGVAPSTASEHLARLVEAGLLSSERQGRTRYFRLADAAVAEAIEALARIAPPEPIRSLRQGKRAEALRSARTCYRHLAGRLGVSLMTAMIDRGLLTGGDGLHRPDAPGADRLSAPGRVVSYRLSPAGTRELAAFGLNLDDVMSRRPPIRYCVDWSEQRHHLSGPLGTALTARLFELDWIRHTGPPRIVAITGAGRAGLRGPKSQETRPN